MKSNWKTPRTLVEHFVPNEYVAACQGENKWLIKCNVPSGYGYFDRNGNGRYDRGEYIIEKGTGCGIYHEVTLPEGEEPRANAMWHPYYGNDFPVYYWQERYSGHSSHHFSIVSKGEWSKNKS